MDRLIELLWEYDNLLPGWRITYSQHYNAFYKYWYWEQLPCSKWSCWEIISKSFWFIHWLLENDKIKKEEIQCIGTDDMGYYYSDEDLLLMGLAIEDKPLEFLCSILK